MILDVLDFLGNIFGGGANTADGKEDVVFEEVFCEDLDVAGEGGAEHEGLAVMNTGHIFSLDDTTDLMFETHVKHTIGLIKDKIPNVSEADTSALDEINKTSGSGAQKVAAPLDLT